MSASPAPSPALRVARQWPWLVLAVLVLVAHVGPHLAEGGTSFAGYWVVGREILAGTPAIQLYDDAWLAARMAAEGFGPDVMLGPPSLALTLAPLAWLPHDTARAVWMVGVLLPALVLSVAWLSRPLGPRLGLAFGALWLLGAPAASGLERAQIYPLMLAVHCLGLAAWRADRPAAGGAVLAPMVLLRGWYGLPQLVGWAVGRRWRAPLAAALTALGAFLLTLPLLGAAAWRHFLVVQVPATAENPDGLRIAYQTWRSLALHLTTLAPPHAPDPPLPGLGAVPWLVGVGLVAAATLWASRRLPPGRGGLGFALWTAAALLLAPVAEDHHMVLAALPAAVLWREHPRARSLVVVAMLLLLPPWPYDVPELTGGWRALAAYPRVYGVGLLWLGCVLPPKVPADSSSVPAP